jgi:hypothetical protein
VARRKCKRLVKLPAGARIPDGLALQLRQETLPDLRNVGLHPLFASSVDSGQHSIVNARRMAGGVGPGARRNGR